MGTQIKPATDNPTIVWGLKQAVKQKPTTKEFNSNPKKPRRARVWAVDFEGTICSRKYPEIGKPNMELVDALKQAKQCGVILILYTARTGKYLDDAVQFCSSLGLEFDYVNENTPDVINTFGYNPRKIIADMYIEDKAFPWWGNGEKGELWKLLQNT